MGLTDQGQTNRPRAEAKVVGWDELQSILDAHRRWVETDGREGQRAELQKADLSGATLNRANLRGADLSSARLRRADLRGADLRHADLTGANLQGADLTRADLSSAILNRANLRDSLLVEADLSNVQGLLTGQLGGSALSGARLSEQSSKFEGLSNVTESSKTTQGLFTSVILVCAYIWLTIASTRDAQLLNNAAPPSSRLPILGTDIPLIQFYLVAPLLLLCLYVYFHLCLQRLWEELAELPAYFPDGRPLDKKAYPWLLNVLVRAHLPRLRENRSNLSRWQSRMSVVLAWGMVPLTILVLWGRYLPAHDRMITALHVVLLASAIGAGFGFLTLASTTLRGAERRSFLWKRAWRDARGRCIVVIASCLMVFGLLSFGAIQGVNPSLAGSIVAVPPEPAWHAIDPRHWVPRLFALIGFQPFANLEDVVLSVKPANWSGGKEDVEFDSVKGADLAGRNLRYAEAYNAFLVNAFLKKTDARGCDFRAADLRRADLRSADLRGSNFRLADMRKADLRNADLSDAILKEINSEEADFSDARMPHAVLKGAHLRKADFTGTDLIGADLSGADLSQCIGLTSAQIDRAIVDARTVLPDSVRRTGRIARKETRTP